MPSNLSTNDESYGERVVHLEAEVQNLQALVQSLQKEVQTLKDADARARRLEASLELALGVFLPRVDALLERCGPPSAPPADGAPKAAPRANGTVPLSGNASMENMLATLRANDFTKLPKPVSQSSNTLIIEGLPTVSRPVSSSPAPCSSSHSPSNVFLQPGSLVSSVQFLLAANSCSPSTSAPNTPASSGSSDSNNSPSSRNSEGSGAAWQSSVGLLAQGRDPVAADGAGRTSLHLAAEVGDTDAVAALLAVPGVDAHAQDAYGKTALHYACEHGRWAVTRLLLERANADPDASDDLGWRPLHLAARAGYLRCLRALLDAGADKDAKTSVGYTALHWASFWGHVECVRALLAAGASTSERNANGRTPLDLADAEPVRQLLKGRTLLRRLFARKE